MILKSEGNKNIDEIKKPTSVEIISNDENENENENEDEIVRHAQTLATTIEEMHHTNSSKIMPISLPPMTILEEKEEDIALEGSPKSQISKEKSITMERSISPQNSNVEGEKIVNHSLKVSDKAARSVKRVYTIETLDFDLENAMLNADQE